MSSIFSTEKKIRMGTWKNSNPKCFSLLSVIMFVEENKVSQEL